MILPQRLSLDLMQTKWASILNPFLSKPTSNILILPSVSLKAGTNVINHKLGRVQQGWFLVDILSPAAIYRNEIFNDKTISLSSDADVVVSLGVY